VPQIEVMFDIDANGIVSVSAKDLGTGKEQKITIAASSNLSDDDIDRAVKEAEQYAEQDRIRKEAVDAKNEADSMIFQTEKLLTDMADKVSDEDKANIQSEMEKLKSVSVSMHSDTMSETDTENLKAAIEEYTKVLHEFSTKMYQAAAPQEEGEPSDYGPDHDVVDGDFTEK